MRALVIRTLRIYPTPISPDDRDSSEFAHLLASFFQTSFHIVRTEFDGKLLDARLKRGAPDVSSQHPRGGPKTSVFPILVNSLRRLAKESGVPLSEKTAQQLAKRKSIHSRLLLWSYVWELCRRATRSSKGPALHKLWRTLDLETRKTLNVQAVWLARQTLLESIEDYQKHAITP